jgi:hypothetical protein
MTDEPKRYSYQAITTLEHGLQVMLDLLTNYFGNAATRTEWMIETQKRFTHHRKLKRGWSNDSIDRKIDKLEKMGLITGGRGFGVSYSAVALAQPDQQASGRKLPADDTESSFLDVLNAAKLQLDEKGKSPPA